MDTIIEELKEYVDFSERKNIFIQGGILRLIAESIGFHNELQR